MRYKEYGKENSQAVIFLHGGGLSWWNYREEAELLKNDFHVILPILDGHAGSDAHFTTIENNAAEIIAFIKENLNGKVFMIGGLSLGGQILLEMLSQQGDICQYALVESAMVILSKLTNKLMKSSISCSYPLIKKKWFSKMQFRSLHMKEDLFDDYYRDTCAVTKEDMIAFLRANTSYSLKKTIKECSANVQLYYGQKELKGIKRSAQIIEGTIPHCTTHELSGLYHGEFSLNQADEYVKIIRKLNSVQ